MNKGKTKKKFIDIENIVDSKHIVTDVSSFVSEWYYMNRDHLTWDSYDVMKETLDKNIVNTIESKFSRDIGLSEHTIVNDGYFKSFILSISDYIKDNYKNYLQTDDRRKIREYLFNLLIIMYSLETQHYFHAISKGEKFRQILTLCDDMFNRIEEYAKTVDINFTQNNVMIHAPSDWNNIIGEIDLIEEKNNNKIIWEVKCTSDITLKNMLQVILYNIIYHNINIEIEEDSIINVNIINFFKGHMIKADITLSKENINRIKNIIYPLI
jgi:hypothetical protein